MSSSPSPSLLFSSPGFYFHYHFCPWQERGILMWCISILAWLYIRINWGALRNNHILAPLSRDSYLIGHDEARHGGGKCALSWPEYGSLLELLSSSMGSRKAMISPRIFFLSFLSLRRVIGIDIYNPSGSQRNAVPQTSSFIPVLVHLQNL